MAVTNSIELRMHIATVVHDVYIKQVDFYDVHDQMLLLNQNIEHMLISRKKRNARKKKVRKNKVGSFLVGW